VSVFAVPPLDEAPWPTLGPGICDLIEERCVHGPGDLRGQPARIDDETRAHIYRAYQVYPRGHRRAGRRRFKRVAISLRKGTAKTEKAAWIMFAELHPEGPVRTDGWRLVDGIWVPVGRPVVDPYIPMVAYTEDQTEELAYGALLFMCTEGPDADLFDAGKEHITRIYGDGKAEALAGSPNAADGARTTCQHFDETHRMILPRLKDARQTMRNNLPKRAIADAWELETTTTYAEGEGSCAEDTHTYAEQVARGEIEDSTLCFFHREAPVREGEDLDDPVQCREAIRVASGPAIARWAHFDSQVEAIAALRRQPDTDKAYWERVWLNRRVTSARQAFDVALWKDLRRPQVRIAAKEPVVLGFDGARWRDAAGFVGTHIETGHQWVHAVWERPDDAEEWEVTDEQVDGALDEAMATYSVRLVYADPPRFEANVARWSGKYGGTSARGRTKTGRVHEWYTNQPHQIGRAMRAYRTAIVTRAVTNDGNEVMTRHMGNARKHDLKVFDDDGTPLWTVEKQRPDSTLYVDLSMAGCLSWKARLDAIARGGWQRRARKLVVMGQR